MERRAVFWNLLLIASFIAASVSLLTTGIGLSRYLSLVLAWPLALAVQMGLFGLAWLLASGKHRMRGLVVALYCLTMPFSVVFSYVMLQSEFTSKIRPEESQRALYDDLRGRSSKVAEVLGRGVADSQELALRLDSWLALERAGGWTTSTCDEADHCYLAGVCERIRRKIETWETRTGTSYQQGPGEALIYGLLETESSALRQVEANLTSARGGWSADDSIFADGLDNRERLRRFDIALEAVPLRDLEAVSCSAIVLPRTPPYDDFARDEATSEEVPVYAFEDLLSIFERGHVFDRGDYTTIFAFFLALFIDVFVLLVALGAGVMSESSPEFLPSHGVPGPHGARNYPVVQPVPPEWGEALRRDITAWIDGALLDESGGGSHRREFLARILEALSFEGGNKALLMPQDAQQSRFGFLLASSRAATPAGSASSSEGGHFVLEDWVYPALARYFSAEQSG